MSAYQVQNQWGGSSAPWHQGSTWILGGRDNQVVVKIDIESNDNGETFTGMITYKNEGPIDFRATAEYGNAYRAQVRWGGISGNWHDDGVWIIGGRDNQKCIKLSVEANNNTDDLVGAMVYLGEGPVGFKGNLTSAYTVENQWGGTSEPWHQGGTWVLSGRDNQNVISMDISSSDNGKTFEGTMVYEGEGPVGLKATHIIGNTFEVYNQWGGSSAPWHRGGDIIIGGRNNQLVIQLKFISDNEGKLLVGEMTYCGEGAIGFKAEIEYSPALVTE